VGGIASKVGESPQISIIVYNELMDPSGDLMSAPCELSAGWAAKLGYPRPA